MTIGGASERQISIQIPKIRDPFLLVIKLAKTGRPGQTTIDRPYHEGYRPLAQEESEWTRQNRCHGHDAQNDIELARKDTAPQLSPSVPFKSKRKRIAESGHRLTVKVTFENPTETPSVDALDPWHPDHLDRAKRCLSAAHRVLSGGSNNQGDVMQLGKRCRMRISHIRHADFVWTTARRQ